MDCPVQSSLATKYHVHINVEICSSIFVIKYLYKYVYKGHDCATAVVERHVDTPGQENNTQSVVANGEWQNCNEIKTYLEGHYVFAFEALWRLFSFRMHEETLSSHALPCTSVECIRSCIMIMPIFLKLSIANKTRKQRSSNTSKPILITLWLEKSRTWIFPFCLHGPMGRKNGPSDRKGVVLGAFISSILPLANIISCVHC